MAGDEYERRRVCETSNTFEGFGTSRRMRAERKRQAKTDERRHAEIVAALRALAATQERSGEGSA